MARNVAWGQKPQVPLPVLKKEGKGKEKKEREREKIHLSVQLEILSGHTTHGHMGTMGMSVFLSCFVLFKPFSLKSLIKTLHN